MAERQRHTVKPKSGGTQTVEPKKGKKPEVKNNG